MTLLTSSIYKNMKRAICLRDKAKVALFFKIIELLLLFKTPRADPRERQRSETRPQGQLECANPRGSPWGGGDGQAWN